MSCTAAHDHSKRNGCFYQKQCLATSASQSQYCTKYTRLLLHTLVWLGSAACFSTCCCCTLIAYKFIRDWVSIWHPMTACVHPDSTHITCNHTFTIIYMSTAPTADSPVLKATCKHSRALSAYALQQPSRGASATSKIP